MTPPAEPPASPAENASLVGHDEAMRQVAAAYATGRMHHAWMIAGPDGIGKATLAYHIAHFVLSGGANAMGNLDLSLPSARLIASGAHPDLFVLARPADEKTGVLKDVIPVEAARLIAPFLHKTPMFGGWRVALIDEAHALNRFGQNTILKLIEEPPPRSLILLTTRAAGALLPTIRSRCRVLKLAPLTPTQIKAVLLRHGVEAEALGPQGLALAHGSVGFAMDLLENDGLSLYDELCGLLRALPEIDKARVQVLADRVGRKGGAFPVLRVLFRNLLRETVQRAAIEEGGDPVLRLPLDRALQVWDKVGEIFAVAETANLDRKLALVRAMTEVGAAVGAF